MKFTSTLFFVQQYGLLGFMVEAPVNPNFLLDKEVILKEDNFISKKCVMKAQDYFDLFFPFANKEEMSFSIVGNDVKINSNSDLQRLLNNTSITNKWTSIKRNRILKNIRKNIVEEIKYDIIR